MFVPSELLHWLFLHYPDHGQFIFSQSHIYVCPVFPIFSNNIMGLSTTYRVGFGIFMGSDDNIIINVIYPIAGEPFQSGSTCQTNTVIPQDTCLSFSHPSVEYLFFPLKACTLQLGCSINRTRGLR